MKGERFGINMNTIKDKMAKIGLIRSRVMRIWKGKVENFIGRQGILAQPRGGRREGREESRGEKREP